MLETIPPELRSYVSYSESGEVFVDKAGAINDYKTTNERDGKRLLDINPNNSKNFSDLNTMSKNTEYNLILSKNSKGYLTPNGDVMSSWDESETICMTRMTSLKDNVGRTIIRAQYDSRLIYAPRVHVLAHEAFGHGFLLMLNEYSNHGQNPVLEKRINNSQEEINGWLKK